MMTYCKYDNKNRLLEVKVGAIQYKLQLLPYLTIIYDNSGTGKSLLIHLLNTIQKVEKGFTESNKTANNIIIADDTITSEDLQKYANMLIIFDDLDELLDDDAICETINRDLSNDYLIIGRDTGDLHYTPNSVGILKKTRDSITMKYPYASVGWI